MTAEVLSQPNGAVANGDLNAIPYNNATTAKKSRESAVPGESRRTTTKPQVLESSAGETDDDVKENNDLQQIDPRHRYGHSLHVYYEEWSKADVGQPFFYWLDVGDGKELDLKECLRSKLRLQCIKYLGPQERMHYEYIVEEGKLIHSQIEELLDTKDGSPGAKW